MNDTPNPADFSSVEKPREYRAIIEVTATATVTIEADSLEEAKAAAQTMADSFIDQPLDFEADEIDTANVERVWKTKPMYRVWCDGKKMQASHLEAGMTPRDPDERGF